MARHNYHMRRRGSQTSVYVNGRCTPKIAFCDLSIEAILRSYASTRKAEKLRLSQLMAKPSEKSHIKAKHSLCRTRLPSFGRSELLQKRRQRFCGTAFTLPLFSATTAHSQLNASVYDCFLWRCHSPTVCVFYFYFLI